MEMKNKAFDVLQGIFIALAIISIVVVVVFKILNGQITNELRANAGINCTQNSTGGTVGVVYTDCGASYDALIDLRTEVVNAITWIGIIVTVLAGFAVIRIMTRK